MSAVLVPIDYSQNSLNALAFAVELGKRVGFSLTVFHSYYVTADPALGVPSPDYLRALHEEREQDHMKRLRKAVEPYLNEQYHNGEGPLVFRFEVRQGMPTENLEFMAESGAYDMVIMGTKGASGAREVIWGSIAHNVVENVELPVIVVPESAKFKGMRHIVYASDFDKQDKQSIADLQELADIFASELTCLHVSADELELAEDREKLAELEGSYRLTPISRVNFELVQNRSVEHGIADYLREFDADMLAVMPKHRGFVEKLMRKSLTKKMTFHAKVPLLVLRNAE